MKFPVGDLHHLVKAKRRPVSLAGFEGTFLRDELQHLGRNPPRASLDGGNEAENLILHRFSGERLSGKRNVLRELDPYRSFTGNHASGICLYEGGEFGAGGFAYRSSAAGNHDGGKNARRNDEGNEIWKGSSHKASVL